MFCLYYTTAPEDPLHLAMLRTIYRQLTSTRVDCPRYGEHWEAIGFQGTDPSTDLRGVGVLGLVTATYLAVTPELLPFTRDLYALSRTQDQVGGDWRAVSHVTSILTSDWSRAPSSR